MQKARVDSVNEQVNPETANERPTGAAAPWSQGHAQTPLETQDSTADEQVIAQVQAGLEAWAEQMETYTGPDAMLDFNQVDYVHIDLTDANSSGVAQMFMGRKTRLSTILRDKAKLEAGMVAARALRTKIFELATGHGLDAGYFVAGTASWLSRDVREDGMVGEKRFIAPILMAPLAITPHPTSDDFEVQLTGPAQLNPAMVRQIKKEYGIDLDTMDVAQLANSMRKLDPEPVIERMRATTGAVPGMTIRSTYFISTFADLKESTGELPATAHTPLVRDIAQLKLNPLEQPFIAPVHNTRESLDSRDPDTDMLVVDTDASGQDIVDLAYLGYSLTVTTAPGTDRIGTAANIAAALIHQGKSVLVVGEKRSTLTDFNRLLERTQLTNLTFDLLTERDSEDYRQEFISAIVRDEKAPAPNVTDIHRELVETRDKLRGHTESLRFTESRWGCSVYEALQTLAALTAQDPAPSTQVRLTRVTMDALSHRAETVHKLQRLADLGGFRPSTRASAWHLAKLTSSEDTAAAHTLVKNLRNSLKEVSAGMALMADETGLKPATSIEDWGTQLDLLNASQIPSPASGPISLTAPSPTSSPPPPAVPGGGNTVSICRVSSAPAYAAPPKSTSFRASISQTCTSTSSLCKASGKSGLAGLRTNASPQSPKTSLTCAPATLPCSKNSQGWLSCWRIHRQVHASHQPPSSSLKRD